MENRAGRTLHHLGRAALVTTALAAACSLWWFLLNLPPTDTIENPPLPNPNAYDFYTRAAALEIGSSEATGATTSPVRNQKVAPYPARLRLLEVNLPALETLRAGFRYPCQPPPVRRIEDQSEPYSRYFRELARCLQFAGKMAEERGTLPEAVECYLDDIRFGSSFGSGGIAELTLGGACENIGCEALWQIVDKMDAPTARHAVIRMEDAQSRRISYGAASVANARMERAVVLDLLRRESTFRLLDWGTADSSDQNERYIDRAMDYAALLLRSKRRIYANYCEYLNACVAREQADFTTPLPPAATPPSDPIGRQFAAFDYDQFWGEYAATQAGSSLLTAAVALRAYRMERGVYPVLLNDLVLNGYLTRIPADPYDKGSPVRYRRTGEHAYLLYSVGPDGNDDGGSPVKDWIAGRAAPKNNLPMP